MGEADRATAARGVPGLVLMENAGARVYELLAHRYSPLAGHRIVVLCGKGNNGGDGFVVARQLATRARAARLDVILLGDPQKLKGDAAANYAALQAVDVEPVVATDSAGWLEVLPLLTPATLLVDALLGTGLRGPAEGLFARVIEDVNTGFPHAKVVAVDMPSGMPSDTGEPLGPTMRADHTVTFTAPKVSQVFPPNCERLGALTVAPIGTVESVFEAIQGLRLSLVEAADIGALFMAREKSSHKGDFGHVLIVGGSRSKPGAVLMAGTAALRSGAGLVTVATAAGAAPAVVSHTPELMTLPATEEPDGSMGASSFDMTALDGKTVVALGPGVGTNDANQALVARIVNETEAPLIVDADGLTALAAIKDWNAKSPYLVLTPHPGEMGRLTGLSSAEVQQRRVEVARSLAQAKGVYVVLKGFRTLIASPDGELLVNPTGTPAMAKGGSGDILTGMIAALLAQFQDTQPELVIAAAVYLHGLAGELAVAEGSEQTLAATDLLGYLPEAIRRVRG
jgi:NAD(P)H-hydrate epimerase